MPTIVMNTLTGAVSEYSWGFKSLSASHAADDNGAYALGGDTDAGAAIDSLILGGKPGGQQVQVCSNVFAAVRSDNDGVAVVQGRDQSWEYPLPKRASGVSSVSPGRGIRESYLGFGYRNTGGGAFLLDRIDADVGQSAYRRK